MTQAYHLLRAYTKELFNIEQSALSISMKYSRHSKAGRDIWVIENNGQCLGGTYLVRVHP